MPHSWLCPPQLRAASEYEERKLIRAAIRKLRAEEIEGEVSVSGLPCRCWDVPNSFLNFTLLLLPSCSPGWERAEQPQGWRRARSRARTCRTQQER